MRTIWIHFSDSVQLKRHLSKARQKMYVLPNRPYIGKNIIIYSSKTFKVLLFENNNIFNFIMFLEMSLPVLKT